MGRYSSVMTRDLLKKEFVKNGYGYCSKMIGWSGVNINEIKECADSGKGH